MPRKARLTIVFILDLFMLHIKLGNYIVKKIIKAEILSPEPFIVPKITKSEVKLS